MNLREIVVKRYGTGREDGELAEVFAMYNEPSACLTAPDGHQYWWAQSLTRPATPDEVTAYWKARAEHAEKRLEVEPSVARVHFMRIGPGENPVLGDKSAYGDGTVGVVVEVGTEDYGVVKVSAADILAAQPFAREIAEVNERLANEEQLRAREH